MAVRLWDGLSRVASWILPADTREPVGTLMQEFPRFGAAEWQKIGIAAEDVPMPEKFEKELDKPCSYWPGKKRRETGLLVLIPSGHSIQQLNTPRPPYGERVFLPPAVEERPPVAKGYWIWITKDRVPEDLASTDQLPTVLEAASAVVAAKQLKGIALYPGDHSTLCQAEDGDLFVHVGSDPSFPFMVSWITGRYDMAAVIRSSSFE